MFKARKLNTPSRCNLQSISTRTLCQSASKYGRKPFNKQLKQNQSAILAKSIIHQLQQQHELGVLKNQLIWSKNKQVLDLLNKCTSQVRCQLFIKLLSFYCKIKAKLSKNYFQKFDQILTYISSISSKNPKKFCDFIQLQRIDESLIYIFKSFQQKRNEIFSKIQPIINKMEEIKQKMQKLMPKEDYELFIVCLSYWKIANKQNRMKITEQTIQNNLQASGITVNSQNQRDFQQQQVCKQRLRKFDKAIENEQFKKHLQNLGRNKKKRSFRRSSSIKQASSKRVSTTWGKQQSHTSNNKQIIKKGEGAMGCSKFNNNAPRKSISILRKQDSLTDNYSQIDVKRFSTLNSEGFRPFYFYTIIKGNIRIISVQKADIIRQTGKLKVYLSGYFCYPLVFHKFHTLFYQIIESEPLKKFILSRTYLKQNKIWKVLAPKKKQSSELVNKNLICQLLEQDEKYKFYGFCKKYNVYFFTQYESQSKKSKSGTLIVYDTFFQDKLELIPINNWKIRQSIQLVDQSIGNQQDNYQYQNRCISVGDFIVKPRQQIIKVLYKNKRSGRFRLDQQKKKFSNSLYSTVKSQGKYVVITQTSINNSLNVNNLSSQPRYRDLFSTHYSRKKYLKCPLIQNKNRYTNQLLYKLSKKRQNQKVTILNRRTGKPYYARIRFQLTFIKKVNDLGFVMCKILIFHPHQGQIILSEAYISQNQKYYVFSIDPSSLNHIFTSDNHDISNQALHDKLAYLIKKIEIVIVPGQNTQSGQFGLALQLGDFLFIEGSELFYRNCITDDNLNPTFIDSLSLKKLRAPKKNHDPFQTNRQVYRIGNNLHNYVSETYKIQNHNILKKYNRYHEFLDCLKSFIQKMYKNPSQFFHKDKRSFHYLLKDRNKWTQKIIKLSISQKQWKIAQHQVKNGANSVKKISINNWNQKYIIQRLKGPELNKYLRRIIRDPLFYRLNISSLEQDL